jgi:CRISPR/Cas system-associated exonuclease Cas4 (RecB family)
VGSDKLAQLEKLSASELNLFHQCPAKWKFIEDEAPSITIDETAMLFGREIHSIIASYYVSLSDNDDLDHARKLIEKAFNDGNDFVLKNKGATLKKVRENFIAFEMKRLKTWKKKKPDMIENRITVKSSSDRPRLVGVIDLYDKISGIIIDWKTSGSDDFRDEQLVQGKMYEMLLKENGYVVNKVYFVNLVEGSEKQLPKVTDGWLEEKIRAMCEKVRIGEFPKKPSPLCGWCMYQLTCDIGEYNIWQEPIVVKSVTDR